MVAILYSNQFGPLSHEQLEAFERQIKTPLPEDYRSFLLQHNGGQPQPGFFWIPPGVEGSGVARFYGIHDDTWSSLETYANEQRYGNPPSMLPIEDDGMSNFVCVNLSPAHYGEIYFIDHELHHFDAQNPAGVIKLAASFSDFLGLLQHEPDGGS